MKAKEAVRRAETEQSLLQLSELKIAALDFQLIALQSRCNEYRRKSRLGLLSAREEEQASNLINQDVLELIRFLEEKLAAGTVSYKKVRDYLDERYRKRLDQKLAKRQPVNLRCIPSTAGTSEARSEAFVAYPVTEIRGTMAQAFYDARGRLLLTGAPGFGKTTLLLQLALELNEREHDFLSVILNLATWSTEYSTLEVWLQMILPAELGVSSKFAKSLLEQNRLILLLDGFDEIRKEDRAACLDVIGRYGADSRRKYVISSRLDEYSEVSKDAPVYWQLEIGPLTIQQIETELKRLWDKEYDPDPGANTLFGAIQRDEHLREVIKTPFYLNTLQILFGSGRTLADLGFVADSPDGREIEIIERFVEYELQAPLKKSYSSIKAHRWLSFLANRMTNRNIVVFELRSLQFDWWKWSRWRFLLASLDDALFHLIYISIIFGIAGLIFLFHLGYGFFEGAIFGALMFSLAFLYFIFRTALSSFLSFLSNIFAIIGFFSVSFFLHSLTVKWDADISTIEDIYTKDGIKWRSFITNFKEAIKRWIFFSLLCGMLIGLFVSFYEPEFKFFQEIPFLDLNLTPIYNLTTGPISKFLFGQFLGIFIALILILIFGPIVVILFSILRLFEEEYEDIIQIRSPYQRFIYSALNFHFSILKHWNLRVQISSKGLLPLRLVTFLNEMSSRHILESDDGTWRFRHRILQNYFANKWTESDG